MDTSQIVEDLTAERETLLTKISTSQSTRANVNEAIRAAKQELVKIDRMIKAAEGRKPRGTSSGSASAS